MRTGRRAAVVGPPGRLSPGPSLLPRVPPPRLTGGCGVRLRVWDLLRGPLVPQPGFGGAGSSASLAPTLPTPAPSPAPPDGEGRLWGEGPWCVAEHREAVAQSLWTAEQATPAAPACLPGPAAPRTAFRRAAVLPRQSVSRPVPWGAPSLRNGADPPWSASSTHKPARHGSSRPPEPRGASVCHGDVGGSALPLSVEAAEAGRFGSPQPHS